MALWSSIGTTLTVPPFGDKFVRNISAKIGCSPFCYYLMALNWHCIDTAENNKNMHKFHTLQCMNNKFLLSHHHPLWLNIHTWWWSSSSVCDDEYFALKYTSCCCCSISSLKNMPPATIHLKLFRPGQPYRISACHFPMQHNYGLTRTVLYLSITFWYPKSHTINHVHQAYHNIFEGGLQFQSLTMLS